MSEPIRAHHMGLICSVTHQARAEFVTKMFGILRQRPKIFLKIRSDHHLGSPPIIGVLLRSLKYLSRHL